MRLSNETCGLGGARRGSSTLASSGANGDVQASSPVEYSCLCAHPVPCSALSGLRASCPSLTSVLGGFYFSLLLSSPLRAAVGGALSALVGCSVLVVPKMLARRGARQSSLVRTPPRPGSRPGFAGRAPSAPGPRHTGASGGGLSHRLREEAAPGRFAGPRRLLCSLAPFPPNAGLFSRRALRP
jgi:hypothetical protein